MNEEMNEKISKLEKHVVMFLKRVDYLSEKISMMEEL